MKTLSALLTLVLSACVWSQVIVTPLFGGGSALELNEKTLKNKVLFFFKADCLSCRQQAKDFGCLKKDQLISLGFSSNSHALIKEARLMGLLKEGEAKKSKVYLASEKVTKAFGMTKDYSPVIFAFNKKGKSKSWLGRQNCQIFARWLAEPSEQL